MASISTDKQGNRRVLFTNRDGQRKAAYLGAMPKKQAETVCTKIEALNAAKIAGVVPADEVSRWTVGIGDDLHAKLLSIGLVDPRNRPTEPVKLPLESFIDRFIQGGGDKSPRTLIHYRQCRGLLIEYFGADKALADITKHDAKLFVSWLRGTKKTVSGNPFAENTVRGHVKTAKTFFNAMVDAELRPDSPFKGISHQQLKRKDRMVFLDRETIRRVLDSCPDARWRAIVVLCRFGGLRCPSELLELRWADIDFERSRMRVRSPKGEKFGKGIREIPLFEEVRTVLEELFMEPGGAEHVISTNDRSGDKNLRTTFEKIIRRAGLEPWERLFQNLRSSRATELALEKPIHIAAEWLGHTPQVALENYYTIRDADFDDASKTTVQPTRIPTQYTSAGDGNASQDSEATNKKTLVPQGYPTKQGLFNHESIHPAGLEPATFGSVD